MQHFMAMGWLHSDPITKEGEEGEIYSVFIIAIPRYGKREEADYIRTICSGRKSEYVQTYLKKGMRVDVMGEIRTGGYERGIVIIPEVTLIASEVKLAEPVETYDRNEEKWQP